MSERRWIDNKTEGFTIVELLIVVVVIAILAAITIVAFNGIQERAKVSSLQQSISQAQQKVRIWKTTNSDTLPPSLVDADPALSDPTWTYQTYDQNTNYCISKTIGSMGYFALSTKPSQYFAGVCSDPKAIDGAGEALVYTTQRGVAATMSAPLSGTPDITLYAVFDVIDMSSGWNVIARLSPGPSLIQLDTGDVNSDSLRYRIDTSASPNATSSKTGRTVGRHIGWVQLQSGVTNRQFNYDSASSANSSSLLPGTGFAFTSLALGSATSATSPVAAIVFNSAHDQTTRARVMQWLANNNNMNTTY